MFSLFICFLVPVVVYQGRRLVGGSLSHYRWNRIHTQ